MTVNVADEIRSAEEKAREILKEARAEAARVIAEAKAEAERKVKETKQQSHREFVQQHREIEAEAETKAKKNPVPFWIRTAKRSKGSLVGSRKR